MTSAVEEATLDRFCERLDDFGVAHTLTSPDGVTGAIESILERPAVGVPLPDGHGRLPDAVTTDPSPSDLRAAATGVTPAALGIADYGSLVLPATPDGIEPVSLFADEHVGVLTADAVVPGMADALARLGDRFRDEGESAIVATGPSATADMGELVRGAHGPKAVHAVVVRT
jgi:L-lactate dehydrogenase complex protein LldG